MRRPQGQRACTGSRRRRGGQGQGRHHRTDQARRRRRGGPAQAEPAGGEVAAGGDAIKRAVTLQKSALAILKSNTKDPKAAAAALEAFQKENADAIATLEQDLTAVQKKLKDDPAAAMEMVSKYADEIGEITKLTMELAGEAPALLEDPAVAAALQKLSPNPGQEDERGDAETEVAGEGGGLSEQDEALLEVGLGHQEKMLAILEQHAADPAKAGAELTKYAEANAAELNKLAEVQRRLANDTEAAMSFAKKNMARVSAMAMKVSKLMKDHPTLLDDPKIVEAMAKLSGD